MTSWPTSTTPAPATGPPKPSTAESNTSAAQPLASEIYSTTSPEHSWTPADSEPKYTHFYDEPSNRANTGVSGSMMRLAVARLSLTNVSAPRTEYAAPLRNC